MITTAQLLVELNAEIGSMSIDLFSIGVDVEPREKVIGVIEDDFLKKIYMLYLVTRREAEMLAVEQRYQSNPDPTARHQLELKSDLLNSMFWYLLKQQLSLFGTSCSHNLALRNGWKVVSFVEADPILRRLMGQQ